MWKWNHKNLWVCLFLYIVVYTHVHPDTEMCMTNETIEAFRKRGILRTTTVELIDNITDGEKKHLLDEVKINV